MWPPTSRNSRDGDRMAAKGIQFPWRWNGGTILPNLDVNWGRSVKTGDTRVRTRSICRVVTSAFLGIALWLPGPAAAEGDLPCPCRYAGETYGQGQCVCMKTPNGQRVACCGRVLNNSSWSFLSDGCPVAVDFQLETPVEIDPERLQFRFTHPVRRDRARSIAAMY